MLEVDTFKAEDEFRQALRDAGLIPPDHILADGRLHRINAEDEKPGKKSGFYVFHVDGLPAGAFGDWHDGPDGWQTWHMRLERELSQDERNEFKRRLDVAREARATEESAMRQEAQDRANRIWSDSVACEAHPYLERKGVQSHGLRVAKDGRLVIPIQDRDRNIVSLEFIFDDGSKLFLSGGKKSGCWFELGQPDRVICIAEGYATAASIHEATGYCVAISFDCGNLPKVAKAIRELHPTAKIIVCADDDQKTKGNPGSVAAAKAAKDSAALVAIPDMQHGGDFNDQHALKGLESVAETIQEAIDADDGPVDACDLFPRVVKEIEYRKDGKSKQSLSFGISSVDKITGGLRRGLLTTMAGRPGAGKTAAAIGVIAHNAMKGIPCLLFSIEMDRNDIGTRFISQNSGVPAFDMFEQHRKLDKGHWSSIYSAADRLSKMAFTIIDRPVALKDIDDETHRWHAEKVRSAGHEIGLVAIDYLGLIKAKDGSESRNLEVAALAKGVKLIIKKLRLCGLLLAQLNRTVTRREGEPEVSDLRDSGEVEEASDMILFPYPWPRYQDDKTKEWLMKPAKQDQVAVDRWLCKKNKNGPTGAAAVLWRFELMQYTCLSREVDNWGGQ